MFLGGVGEAELAGGVEEVAGEGEGVGLGGGGVRHGVIVGGGQVAKGVWTGVQTFRRVGHVGWDFVGQGVRSELGGQVAKVAKLFSTRCFVGRAWTGWRGGGGGRGMGHGAVILT